MSKMDRFMEKVRECPVSGCWLWAGFILPKGYGRFRNGASMQLAHRSAFTLFRGAIPEGMQVCHRCDNPSCVNPDHLFLGTCAENAMDKVSKGRQVRGERSHLSKLTLEQVQEIRATAGPRDEVARRYGVSGSLVSYIRRGEIWKGDAHV